MDTKLLNSLIFALLLIAISSLYLLYPIYVLFLIGARSRIFIYVFVCLFVLLMWLFFNDA